MIDMTCALKGFDEATYFELNPDVFEAVQKGVFSSGWEHYLSYGVQENRPGVSTSVHRTIQGIFSMIPTTLMSDSLSGGGDFLKIGQEFKNYFIEQADVKPDTRVLDVGCGIGRMAVPLTNYLSHEGGYWGFDVVKDGIEWCQTRISPKFKNFHFLHGDIYNKHYNPKGTTRAQDYQFPFDDEFFDFISLTSVFTHMLPSDLENYMSEIYRVLKPGGNCLITFFILNEESENLIRSGRSSLDFVYKIEEINGCLTIDKSTPETAIAYEEEFVKMLFKKYCLKITQPVRYGSWCNRAVFLSYQDIIFATKGYSA